MPFKKIEGVGLRWSLTLTVQNRKNWGLIKASFKEYSFKTE